jgi:hypothetical protein
MDRVNGQVLRQLLQQSFPLHSELGDVFFINVKIFTEE